MPRGLSWKSFLVAGTLAGIGFTMAIFLAVLGFAPATLQPAKAGILLGSTVSAIIGLALGRFVLEPPSAEIAAVTVEQAEQSTEL